MDAGTAVASSEKPKSSAAAYVPLALAAMAKGEKARVTSSGDKLTMKHPEPVFTKVPPQVRQCFCISYVLAYCNIFLIYCTNDL